MNNFSYADDLVLICPSASALNDLLRICEKFGQANYILYNVTKTECMCIPPKNAKSMKPPDIILYDSKLKYVNNFKYLGHIMNNVFTDDDDIAKELRNLYARGNTLITKFKSMCPEVKISLFKSYCYPLYCASQWSCFKVGSGRRLRVGYNAVLRRLMGVKLWDPEQERLESMSALFVTLGLRSLPELLRYASYSCMERIRTSENTLLQCLQHSEARLASRQWTHWEKLLLMQY